ncbi:MAG: hypothetical protein HC850_14365, partial [Rhodomicrobium sp.]|nr:hypothetical protein [Rhodomicrobium sp.]
RCVLRAYAPSAGEIRFRVGDKVVDLAPLPKRALKPYRRHMQMVFQDPFSSLNPRMVIADIIGEPLLINGMRNAEERRKREVEPTLTMLRDVLVEAPHSPDERHAQARMREMHDLIEMLTKWYEDVQKMETARLVQLLKLGSKVYKLYEMRDKLKLIPGGKAKTGAK